MKVDDLRRGLDEAGNRPGIDVVDALASVDARAARRRRRSRQLVGVAVATAIAAVAVPVAVLQRDPGTSVRVAPQPIVRANGWALIQKGPAGLATSSSFYSLASTDKSLLLAGALPIHGHSPRTDDSWRPAIWYSDNGLTWQDAHVPATATGLVRAIATSGDTALAIGSDNVGRAFVWRSDDDGRTWNTVTGFEGLFGAGSGFVSGLTNAYGVWIASGGGTRVYGSGGRAAVWTSSDGRHWQPVFLSKPEDNLGGVNIVVDARDGQLLAYSGNIMWTSGNGTTWSRRVVASIPDGFDLGAVAPGSTFAFGKNPLTGGQPTPLLRQAGGRQAWLVDPTFLAQFPGARVASVTREQDLWIALGTSGSPSHPDAWISADGISWRSMPASLSHAAGGILVLAGSVAGRLVVLGTPYRLDRSYVDRYYTFDISKAADPSDARETLRQHSLATWNDKRPDAYKLRVHLEKAFGTPPNGDYVVSVTGNEVTAVQRADDTPLAPGPQWSDFSVDGTFDVLRSALRNDADDSVRVTYDLTLGYPRSVDVNSEVVDGDWSARFELLRV